MFKNLIMLNCSYDKDIIGIEKLTKLVGLSCSNCDGIIDAGNLTNLKVLKCQYSNTVNIQKLHNIVALLCDDIEPILSSLPNLKVFKRDKYNDTDGTDERSCVFDDSFDLNENVPKQLYDKQFTSV